MTAWRTTPALQRALLLAGLGAAGAVLTGSPALVVLTVPFAVLGVLGLLARPATAPAVRVRLDHHRLHEGQGTAVRLDVDDLRGVEYVTRVAVPAPYVATRPASGAVGGLVAGDGSAPSMPAMPVMHVGPRRWGRRPIGVERVALTGAWAGWRWGPVGIAEGPELVVLPQSAPFDSRAEVPQPDGLVGAHRARRVGSGSEFEGIRHFTVGDRLRRISWPVSLRTGTLHAVTTRAEQDAGVWLVVDALRDVGVSEGVDGRASSLDLTVRAAAALADHHVRRGDRVGLVVVGAGGARVPLGTGPRHLQRLVGTLARIRPSTARASEEDVERQVEVGAAAGSIVHVLSPMMHAPMVTAAVTWLRRGLAVVVVDTLGPTGAEDEGPRLSAEALAWRMREIERVDRLDRLAGLGCPVVTWRGPGTLDEVLHRLARRSQVPRLVTR